MIGKRGQLTIFIIVAIVLVVAVAIFFIFRGSLIKSEIPKDMDPLYTSFLGCIEEDTMTGIDLAETQGGYVYIPELELGSSYMPFSSQLNFLGNPVPYWYYVSGNNIQKEQVPSLNEIQNELSAFLEKKIKDCKLEAFYQDGFEVKFGEPKANIKIEDKLVTVNLEMPLSITKGNESVVATKHKVSINSELGGLYKASKKIYDYEQSSLFLENYAVDTMRIYAPVDGVELTCSPLVWSANEVFDELEQAIEANTLALKTQDGDYSLTNKDNRYFITDISTGYNVRFINSKDWPNYFEVLPTESDVLQAEPVGTQEGLGILGFCFVPYHFVYNIAYPVLIQVESGDEIFQFPVVVIVKGNEPRESLDISAVGIEQDTFCSYINTPVSVGVYNNKMEPVEATIYYKCLESRCDLGKTKSTGPVTMNFPQCVNGYVVANAEGYKEGKELFSSAGGGQVSILLDKLYQVDVDLKVDEKDYNDNAIISFISDDYSKTILYPKQKSINLSEGQYEVDVSVYRNSSLKIAGSVKKQCISIPQSGLGGLIGLEQEKCFYVNIPAQVVSSVLSAGGKQNYYILESELADSQTVEIHAQSLPVPNSIDKLQENYELFDNTGLDIEFK
jgi:hypothetical protein